MPLASCQALGIRAAVRLVAGQTVQISDALVPTVGGRPLPSFPLTLLLGLSRSQGNGRDKARQ